MPQIQLIITLDDTGQIGVTGPINNQLMCYGMLEMAKIAVTAHAKQNEQIVKPANGVLLPPQPGR